MESVRDYLDVLRDNYYDEVKKVVEGALKSGQITEDEATDLLASY